MKTTSSFVIGALALTLAGSAFAQDKKAAPPPPPAKAAPADKGAPAEPAKPEMKMPTPAQEVLDAAKAMNGTWKCKGTAQMGPEKSEWEGTAKFGLDIDKFFIKGEFASKKSKTNPVAYKGVSYRTYEPGSKKWYQTSVDNMGGFATAWAGAPAADGKVTWEGEGTMMGMKLKSRDYEQWVTANKEIHIWGEASMDGKTWMPVYDMTCKK